MFYTTRRNKGKVEFKGKGKGKDKGKGKGKVVPVGTDVQPLSLLT